MLAALNHPRQQAACQTIVGLIDQLRACSTDGDYFAFQRDLFGEILRAEQHQWDASRQVTRGSKRRLAPPNDSSSWALEQLVSDRIVRQLKTVGDALAWRRFGFRRRPIVALSRDDGGGPMYGKTGLQAEWDAVTGIWEMRHHFSLLNGLTNCVRVGDVTEFGPDGIDLHEVKTNPSERDRRQERRLAEVCAAANEGAPLPTGNRRALVIRQCELQLRTRARADLSLAVKRADQQGTGSVGLGKGWVLNCVSAIGLQRVSAADRDPQTLLTVTREAWLKAGMGSSPHNFRFSSLDQAGRAGDYAPMSIYPLTSGEGARLICDYLVFESVMTWERLKDSFERAGFNSVTSLLPEAHTYGIGDEYVAQMEWRNRWARGRGTMVIQVLAEFIDPDLYAKAFLESVRSEPATAYDTTFVFANERAAWR